MLRLLGAAVLAGCAAFAGFAARRRLHDRTALLRALAAALCGLERELSFRLTPLPRLFERAAAQSPTPVAGFFRACAAGMQDLGSLPLAAVWDKAMDSELPALTGEEREILRSLGTVLGRYDGERQREALREAAGRLEVHIAAAAEQRDRLGRVYSALGVTGGLFLLILMI